MKQKVGTVIEEDVLRQAKRRAIDEGRPLSDIIQAALQVYLTDRTGDPALREAAYRLYCEKPLKLTVRQRKMLLEEDAWNL